MNVVNSRLCASSGHWRYPFRAVKYLAFDWAISATASTGVTGGYSSRQTNWLSLDKSALMRILSEFLGATMIGEHHSVGSVAGAIMPCSTRRSIFSFNLSLYAKGTVCVVVTQKDQASSLSDMWNCSPGKVRILPSRTVENFAMICSAVTDALSLYNAGTG